MGVVDLCCKLYGGSPPIVLTDKLLRAARMRAAPSNQDDAEETEEADSSDAEGTLSHPTQPHPIPALAACRVPALIACRAHLSCLYALAACPP